MISDRSDIMWLTRGNPDEWELIHITSYIDQTNQNGGATHSAPTTPLPDGFNNLLLVVARAALPHPRLRGVVHMDDAKTLVVALCPLEVI